MRDKKLENLYAYKGNEKFLSEIEIHRMLYICKKSITVSKMIKAISLIQNLY